MLWGGSLWELIYSSFFFLCTDGSMEISSFWRPCFWAKAFTNMNWGNSPRDFYLLPLPLGYKSLWGKRVFEIFSRGQLFLIIAWTVSCPPIRGCLPIVLGRRHFRRQEADSDIYLGGNSSELRLNFFCAAENWEKHQCHGWVWLPL